MPLRSADGATVGYFSGCGKAQYSAPECAAYSLARLGPDLVKDGLPTAFPEGYTEGAVLQVQCEGYFYNVRRPAGSRPGQGAVAAEVCGYGAAPVDVFESGVVLFLMLTLDGNALWRRAVFSDPKFHEAYSDGVRALLRRQGYAAGSAEALELIEGMLHWSWTQRWSVDRCLASGWLAPPAEAAGPA